MLLLLASLLALLAPSAAIAPKCEDDKDCSLNGVCTAGACICDPGWTSNIDGDNTLPLCNFLDFLPSPVSTCGPACAFHGGPSSVDPAWTSWGMSVREEADGSFHGYAAEMANECGLNAWTRGSQVVHATAPTPLGPFLRTSVVVEPWAHNPQIIRAPDGKYVLFTLGDGWPQNGPPANCTSAPPAGGPGAPLHARVNNVGNCTPVAEPSNCDPSPCYRCNITLHVADAPGAQGPWTPFPTSIVGLSAIDNINNWNPAPMVLPNGSIAVMIHTDDDGGWRGEVIATAPTWAGPFVVTVPDDSVTNVNRSQEDPFMWYDRRGHWHVLVHKMFDPPETGACGIWSGGHLFSEDGTQWSPMARAYNTTVFTTDGGSTTFGRRERPKLIFDAQGRPTHLFNGAIPATGNPYTIVAPINLAGPGGHQ